MATQNDPTLLLLHALPLDRDLTIPATWPRPRPMVICILSHPAGILFHLNNLKRWTGCCGRLFDRGTAWLKRQKKPNCDQKYQKRVDSLRVQSFPLVKLESRCVYFGPMSAWPR